MKNPLIAARRLVNDSTFFGVTSMKLRNQILAGFMVVFTLLVINSTMMFWSISSLVTSEQWVAHTYDVISKARLTEKLIVDMETGERGFLLTGEDEFLAPMEAGEQEQRATFEALSHLVSDNPKQVERLAQIEALVRKWGQVAAGPEIAERRKAAKVSVDADYLQNLIAQGMGKSIVDAYRKQADRLDKLFEQSEQNDARYLVLQLVNDMIDLETGERGFLVTGAEEFLEPYQDARKRIDHHFEELHNVAAKSTGARKDSILRDIDDLKDIYYKWLRKAGEPEIEARREMNKGDSSLKTVAALIKKKKGKQIVDELRVHVDQFVAVEQGLLEERTHSAARAAWSSVFVVGIGTVLAILFGLVAMQLVSRNILRQVGGEPGVIADIAEQISTGKLDFEIPGDEKLSTGILRSVRRMLNSLKQNEETSEQRDWLKTGVVRVNEVTRGEQDIVTVAAKVTSEICTYLDAKVGALYVMDDDGDGGLVLSLLGSYAYTKRKNISNRFKLGEGIVGQAAMEKQQILVKDVPEEYVRVVSGLGDSPPRFICVTPLVYEGRVIGVLEIGALGKLSDVELDYLSQTMPLVAIAFESAKSRVALREALQESEGLSRNLQLQQEELKASNEELEEQSRALQHSEEQLKTQQEELEVVNEELEEKNRRLTQQKREVENAQQAISEKAEEVALASKYKSEFLANMSHELRTPLNSLLLLARSLRDNREGNLSKGQIESAGIIYGSGNDLLVLINEILDLSKIEAGRMSLDLEGVELEEVAQNIKDSFQHMAADKGLVLAVNLSDGVPGRITTDSRKLQQVLKNLIANALKFTERGHVEVRFHPPATGVDLSRSGLDPRAAIAISVMDTGIGIARDHQKVIFEAFQQADGSTSRKYGGTGLGLSISRELVKLLGGEIQLVSTPDEGSTFTVYVPREIKSVGAGAGESGKASPTAGITASMTVAAPGPKLRPAPAEVADDRDELSPKDRSILIIEDDSSFARILVMQCHERGLKCLVAPAGEEGLALARKYQPSAVILDIKLPGIDGWQVLDRIKEDTTIRHIPVHVMSVEEPSTKAFKKGAIGHLQKPVTTEGLQGALANIEKTTSGNVKRLLVVEDNDRSRRAIVDLVSGEDVEVDQASGANEAIQAILKNHYDCMILDLGLWDMDGEKLLEAIKRDKQAKLPPVIVYTGRALSREEELRLREHTQSIIIKDVRSEERLLDEVSLFLHRIVHDMPPKKRQVIIDLHDTDVLFQGKKILVVEDDMRSAFAVSKLLTERGMTVFKAENGQAALAMLEKQPDIDLALMDIMMPVMDGYETIARIRKTDRFAKLPILALTAKAMKGDVEKCMAVGANDYLAKPIDEDRLLSMMRVWLYN